MPRRHRFRPSAVICVYAFAFAFAWGACDHAPSRLDGASEAADPDDPWAGNSDDAGNALPAAGGSLGGFDLPGVLSKITESMKKPGPYEAPGHSAAYAADKPHLGVLELDGRLVERRAYSLSPFGGGGHATELHALLERLRGLAADDNVTGLILRIGALDASLPDIVELRAVLHQLRDAGKTLACHTQNASNASYLVLAACDRIGIAPLGQVAITGPAAMPIHVKGLLDKLGVRADFLHVGAYKGAAEPLTRNAPSKEMEETIDEILERHYQTMVDAIGRDRQLDAATVKSLIDTGLFSSEQAKTSKLVDEVTSFEAFRDGAHAEWTELPLDDTPTDKLSSLLSVMRFLGATPPDRPVGDHVAVIYAIGNIVDGTGDGILGARQEIASGTLVAALRAIAADDSIKAVVLRIDSGGGSAQASELIWRAIADLRARKPVIVSMSDVAASGGYYIASGATRIYALDDTLTGSIGVVGGKLSPGGALSKLGIDTFPRGKGKHATLFASLAPWTPDDKELIQKSMEDVYAVFTSRVAAGRKLPLDRVKELAQGRVWTGTRAKELGLVDDIGGLDAAIAKARELGHVTADTDLEVYPPSPTLRDVIQSWGGNVSAGALGSRALAALGLDTGAAADALSPALGDAVQQLVSLALSFGSTHVQTVAVLPMIR